MKSVYLLAALIPAAFALTCHVTTMPLSVDQPISTVATYCPVNSMTCMKAVDMTARTYTKSCSYNNCTNPQGITNQPAACFNYSVAGREAYNCCCYGDGCNSAPKPSFVIAGMTLLATIFF